MKTMKKLASVALALVMALCLTVPALAADVTIKLPAATTDTDPKATETYKAYKIFDAAVAGENGGQDITDPDGKGSTFDHVAYSITSDSPFYETVDGFEGIELTALKTENEVTTYNVAVNDSFDAATFAVALQTLVNTEGFTGTVAAEATATLEQDAKLSLADGYFLIIGSLGSKAILDTVGQKNVTITTKNDLPTIKKTTEVEIVGKKVGDQIPYVITVNAKPGATKYVVHDTMGVGLTFDNNVKLYVRTVDPTDETKFVDTPIENAENDIKYTVVSEGLTDGCTFEVVFAQSYLDTITAATDIVIKYSATINSEATLDVDTTTNKAQLKYGENGFTPETEDTKTETPLYRFDLVKTNSDNMGKEVLEGAKFKLYSQAEGGEPISLVLVAEQTVEKEDGTKETIPAHYRPAMAGETGITEFEAGVVTVMGLGTGTWYLEETQQPAGYNKMKNRTTVELTGNLIANVTPATEAVGETPARPAIWNDGGVRVINYSGAELPETGGIGTTIFYIVGGLLAVGAGVLLVTKKKMGADEE